MMLLCSTGALVQATNYGFYGLVAQLTLNQAFVRGPDAGVVTTSKAGNCYCFPIHLFISLHICALNLMDDLFELECNWLNGERHPENTKEWHPRASLVI